MIIKVTDTKTAKEGIIAIGKSLIDRAEDITNDLKNVKSITIYAELNPCEIVGFDIKKEYAATIEE